MNKLNSGLLLSGALAVALLAGCGGGNNASTTPTDPTADLSKSISAVIDHIGNMIANYTENSDPVDINSITLAVDDTAEPTGLK